MANRGWLAGDGEQPQIADLPLAVGVFPLSVARDAGISNGFAWASVKARYEVSSQIPMTLKEYGIFCFGGVKVKTPEHRTGEVLCAPSAKPRALST